MVEQRGKIRVIDSCNNDCKFCSADSNSKGKPMNLNEIKKRIDEIKTEGSTEFLIYGGEPTLRKDIFDILDYAISKKFERIKLQTNGRSFFYESFTKKILKYNLDIIISIHGHNKEIHNFLTNSDSFNQTIKGIRNLIKYKQNISSNTVITKYNSEHLEKIAELLIRENIQTLQFALMHPFGRGKQNFKELAESLEKLKPHIIETIKICNQNKRVVYFEGFPLCTLGDFKECATEFTLIKNINSYSNDDKIIDYRNWIKKHKSKEKVCECCKYNTSCEGFFKEYKENELVKINPITD